MKEILNNLGSNFMPHGMCFRWLPEILWTHVLSDAAIAIAYYSIPLSILYFIRQRDDVSFPQIGALFAAFIFLCGTTHLFAIWVVWNGTYGLQGILKALTAVVSVATAYMTWRLLPQALMSPSQLLLKEQVNAATEELTATNQELGRANMELESFVSIASHDLKEPLRTLASFSQLLEQDLGDNISDDVRTDLHHIVNASRRMQDLVQDLLDLSRTSRADLRLGRVSVDACVDEALSGLETKIKESGAQIDRTTLPTVLGDKTLLIHVYQNLIANALKFAKPGCKPQLCLTAEVAADGQVVLGVADNGIGIAPEWHEKIFEPFERLHGRSEYEGAGIGLAICHKAIDRLGGQIWVEAREDAGAHFKFSVRPGSDRTLEDQPAMAQAQTGHPAC